MPHLSYNELVELVPINKDTLDIDLEKQPFLFGEVAEGQLRAIAKRDRMKTQMTVLEAEVSIEYRREWMTITGEEKFSEAKLVQFVRLDSRIKDMADQFTEINIEVTKWTTLLDAVRRRGDSLHYLASLYGSQYFARRH